MLESLPFLLYIAALFFSMWRWEKRKDGLRQLTYAKLLVVGVIFTAVALFLSHGPEERQLLIFGSTPFYVIGAPLTVVAAVTLAVKRCPRRASAPERAASDPMDIDA